LSYVGRESGDVDERRHLGIVAGFRDDHATPGMADENGFAVLLRECLFGRIDVSSKGGERIFDKRDVVALLRENSGNGLPARLVTKAPCTSTMLWAAPLGNSAE